MKFEIDADGIIRRSVAEAKSRFEDSADTAVRDAVRTVFASGKGWGEKTEGLGHEIVRKKVEDYILSDKFAQRVDEIIDRQCEDHVSNAIRVLLASKVRKHLFEAVPVQYRIRRVSNPAQFWDGERGCWTMNANDAYTTTLGASFPKLVDGEWEEVV